MTREELLAVIEKARQSRLTTLDLVGGGIEELPSEIGQLTNLTNLDLSHNSLTALPDAIRQLTNLTSLDLSSNHLKVLPESIGKLSSLETLELGFRQFCGHDPSATVNRLEMLPESIGKLTNLKFFNLEGNRLISLPDSIEKLTNLEFLNLKNNRLTSLPGSIEKLTNLLSLNLGRNQLSSLPGSIGKLIKLTSLNLEDNRLTSLPDSIEKLINLLSLNLGRNQLSSLPDSIGKLIKLTSLNLEDNRLTSLPDSMSKLNKLKLFRLENNQVKESPESIGQWKKLGNIYLYIDIDQNLIELTSLDLSQRGLKTLPDEIGQLEHLESLNLCGNDLSELPRTICHLGKLDSLILHGNRFESIPDFIGGLTQLKSLQISHNRLNSVPDSIGKLLNLIKLDLSNNNLSALPESIGELPNIRSLELNNNKLQILPNSIGSLDDLVVLKLEGNPLDQIPPEIVKKGGLAVRDYYRQRLHENTDYIYEAKLLVIGEGGAGKTSLANKLIDSSYTLKLESSSTPEKSTEGIDVLRLNFDHSSGNPFRINIWDFGGQEIYHATHQFFLTKRSLYLLVADTRQDNTDFNYWLEVVELLSDASPTLIIKNEKQERPCDVNEKQLRGRFPNLEKILPTNLATNRGLPKILDAVQHHISQLPHIGTPLPKTWVNVRKALEDDLRNYISQDEFLTLCDTQGFKRRQDKLQLSGYLHDLGVCLHFQDDPVLKHVVILKPEWGTAAVYKTLDTPKVRAKLGCFTQTDLSTIWSDAQYADMHDELLQLMMRFKLCYEIPHRPKTYIAPQLLSPNQPEYDWDDNNNLILRYHYEFMPKGMLTRFIVEMHKLIDNELVWKEGVILKDENARAEVIEAYYKNEIRIRIAGKLKKPLLENIRHEFRKIHESYNKPEDPPEKHRLHYQEFIPCNCSVCKGSQIPFSYSLDRLQERLKNNRYQIECDISYEMVEVRSLIDDAIGFKTLSYPQNRDRPEYHIHGDWIEGDKIGQDKIGGDKTETHS
jgi:internalin A